MATKITRVSGTQVVLFGLVLSATANEYVTVPTVSLQAGLYGFSEDMKAQFRELKVLLDRGEVSVLVEGTAVTNSTTLAAALAQYGTDVSGTQANRPSSPYVGQEYFNTTTGKKESWNGSAWVSHVAAQRHHETMKVVAPGTTIATIQESQAAVSATTQPGHPTTLRVDFAAGYTGGNVTVTGKKADMVTAETETFVVDAGQTVAGTKVFGSIDANGVTNATPAGTSDAAVVKTHTGIGVANIPVASFDKLCVDGVSEAFSASSLSLGSFVPTTAPNGTKLIEVWYTT